MRATWLRTTLLLVLVVLARPVKAQYQPVNQTQLRPALSPYLNLARPGSPGINYYGIVRPELQNANAIGSLQQQLNTLETATPTIDPQTGLPMLYTGHPVMFNNLSHYYGNFNRLNASPYARPIATSGGALQPRLQQPQQLPAAGGGGRSSRR